MSWSEPITQLVASLPAEFWLALAVGFAAQLVDGALGMAYGVTASSLLVAFGMPPAIASAIVHAAECFTTGASAVAHRAFGNVDGRLFRRLLPAAAVGAVVGASVAALVPTEWLRPYVSAYLAVMGAVIVGKAFRPIPPPRAVERVSMLGFVGAFLDAVGGGVGDRSLPRTLSGEERRAHCDWYRKRSGILCHADDDFSLRCCPRGCQLDRCARAC